MKYAIDRYSIGVETEVNAEDFDGSYYIPGRKNRFYCPECGEIVFFRAKGGNKSSHFYHQDKTDQTPECDRRVDGRSELSLNQRVGLSLFLTCLTTRNYRLSIGFPALGEDLLNKAANNNYTVEISAGEKWRKIKVDPVSFIEDEQTLIPINFIPPFGQKYAITMNGDRSVYGLRRKWSDFADGFERGGALFAFDDAGGKKIRNGDCISTYRTYFAVVQNNSFPYPEIDHTEIGKLVVDGFVFRVMTIMIKVCAEQKTKFIDISDYLKRQFGVWLLECQPELIPLWPPVIQRGYQIPVSINSKQICAISSGNTYPTVYAYSESGVFKKEINIRGNSLYTVEFSVGNEPLTLSVDRKYVGREVTFISKTIEESGYRHGITLKKANDGTIVPLKTVDSLTLSSELLLITNGKCELYIGTKDKRYKHVAIRDNKTVIPAIKETTELCFLVESRIMWYIYSQDIQANKGERTEWGKLIEKAKVGRKVPIPRWADALIRKMKREHNKELFNLVLAGISDGKIYDRVLEVLRIIELSDQNRYV